MKAYVVVFYVDVSDLPPEEVSSYTETIRQKFIRETDFEDLLNAQVMLLCVPRRHVPTKLEIHEFHVGDASTQGPTLYDLSGKTVEEIIQILTTTREQNER